MLYSLWDSDELHSRAITKFFWSLSTDVVSEWSSFRVISSLCLISMTVGLATTNVREMLFEG
jgi:hypothetical protein